MRNTLDVFGQEITAGDVILYTVSNGGGSMKTRIAVVDKVVYDADSWEQYILKVRAYNPNHLVFQYEDGALVDYSRVARVYRTTLTSNQTIVRLNKFTFPEGFRKLLRL